VQSKVAQLWNQEYHLSDPNLKREVIGGDVSVLIIMERAGVTEEQCEEAIGLVNWEGNTPKGGILHVSAIDPPPEICTSSSESIR
jgi:hypothetical protein